MGTKRSVIRADRIQNYILLIRGEKVMLDADLAVLYGVETRVLVQAVCVRQTAADASGESIEELLLRRSYEAS